MKAHPLKDRDPKMARDGGPQLEDRAPVLPRRSGAGFLNWRIVLPRWSRVGGVKTARLSGESAGLRTWVGYRREAEEPVTVSEGQVAEESEGRAETTVSGRPFALPTAVKPGNPPSAEGDASAIPTCGGGSGERARLRLRLSAVYADIGGAGQTSKNNSKT